MATHHLWVIRAFNRDRSEDWCRCDILNVFHFISNTSVMYKCHCIHDWSIGLSMTAHSRGILTMVTRRTRSVGVAPVSTVVSESLEGSAGVYLLSCVVCSCMPSASVACRYRLVSASWIPLHKVFRNKVNLSTVKVRCLVAEYSCLWQQHTHWANWGWSRVWEGRRAEHL